MADFYCEKTYSQSFVFYESAAEVVERVEQFFGKEAAYDFVKAILDFGLWGVVPDSDNIVWAYGFDAIIASIGAAKRRYESAVESGRRGGRPRVEVDMELLKELKKKGYSNETCAKYLGVSKSTVQRRTEELDLLDKLPNFQINEPNEFGM